MSAQASQVPRPTSARTRGNRTGRAITLAVLAVLALLCFLPSPLARARGYSDVIWIWHDHWPLSRGQFAPTRLLPVLERIGVVQPVELQTEPGVVFLVTPDDIIESYLLHSGTWDPEVWSIIKSKIGPGATMIDVGAHIGTMSLRAARVVGDTGSVVAVEPNPNTLRKLRTNIALSGAWNILVEPVACGATEGKLPLYVSGHVNSGGSSLSKNNALNQGGAGTSVEVPIVPLDSIVERAGLTRIDEIKLDVEGAEVQVLRGAENSIRKFRPAIVSEVIDEQLRNMGSSQAEFESVLKSYGYVKIAEDSSKENALWGPAGK